jgi:type II secretory pathway pseudopilin PulG
MHKKKGMTMVEVLVSVAVFVFVSIAVYEAYAGLLSLVSASRIKITAANLANEQFEIAKNLPYASVGTIAGIPSGSIPPTQTLSRDGKTFTDTTAVRNIDDPFDGTLGGTPNDTSPADYKLVEISITCDSCQNFSPITLSARVSPKSLEVASTNGSLFIHVFDANGVPIQGVNVHIVNNSVVPAIDINDVTDVNGLLQIVDTPPSVQSYEITVTKTNYSTDKTYLLGAVGNPDPIKPHATVAIQTVTDISFSIDKLSTIEISTKRNNCSAVGNIDFSIAGAKLIGNPDVLKYSTSQTTSGSGDKTIDDLEWDTYQISLTDPDYYLAGTISPLPISLSPDSTQNASLILADKDPNGLMVSVKDNSNNLPLSSATVTLFNGGFSGERVTGRGFIRQTDWSGGPGQEDGSANTDRFFTEDGNLEYNVQPGIVTLEPVLGVYSSNGYLESSTFDTGAAATFFDISWAPSNQPVSTGADPVKFQIATSNNDDGPWAYTGPDGTASTYYTLADRNISASNNGRRYFRYKMYLSTDDTLATPSVSDVSFTFSSACAPPGQVLFTSLNAEPYTLRVERVGYQTYEEPIVVVGGWQSIDVPLLPN